MVDVATLMNGVLAVTSTAVMALPVIGGLDRDTVRGRFLWAVCLSFFVPVLFVVQRFLGIDFGATILTLHTIVWVMLLGSFLSFYLEKRHFFWSQFAIPLSLLFPVIVLRQFIFEMAALIALIVLAEIMVYMMVDGNFLARLTGMLGVGAVLSSLVYYFPLPLFTGLLPQVMLSVSYLFLLPLLWLMIIHPRRDIDVSASPDLIYVWYAVLSLVTVVVAGLFSEVFNPIYVGLGVIVIALLAVMSHHRGPVAGIEDFTVVLFLLSVVVWLVVSLVDVGTDGAIVVIDFQVDLLQLAIISAVSFIGLRFVTEKV
jgi:hypothetical protein